MPGLAGVQEPQNTTGRSAEGHILRAWTTAPRLQGCVCDAQEGVIVYNRRVAQWCPARRAGQPSNRSRNPQLHAADAFGLRVPGARGARGGKRTNVRRTAGGVTLRYKDTGWSREMFGSFWCVLVFSAQTAVPSEAWQWGGLPTVQGCGPSPGRQTAGLVISCPRLRPHGREWTVGREQAFQ